MYLKQSFYNKSPWLSINKKNEQAVCVCVCVCVCVMEDNCENEWSKFLHVNMEKSCRVSGGKKTSHRTYSLTHVCVKSFNTCKTMLCVTYRYHICIKCIEILLSKNRCFWSLPFLVIRWHLGCKVAVNYFFPVKIFQR